MTGKLDGLSAGSTFSATFGKIPYRMAFAGGWIDQPFVSWMNPTPPGSMVVAAIEPDCRFMDRCGMGTSTRKVAAALWGNELPADEPEKLVRQLYAAENKDKPEPSGSQDMAGLIYPGINRLDYDIAFEAGYFPAHIESCRDTEIIHWLERVVYMLPVNQRPEGYNPFGGTPSITPDWVLRLGNSGKSCYDAILSTDIKGLGESMNECMRCWETLLPYTVHYPTSTVDLAGLLGYYQRRYAGAMYSGCGGGYLYVISDEPVPGGFQVKIRN